MAFYLRKVSYQRWILPDAPWLAKGDIPADPFYDLRTDGNALSIYRVDSDKGNVERIVVAMAATSKYTHKPVDYLLFDDSLPLALGIQVVKSNGKTRDDTVNSNWHYDLVELTANTLQRLLQSLWNSCELDRKYKKELLPLIKKAVQTGQIPKERLPSEWQQQL